MTINIDDNEIENMVNQQVREEVRKRIKEMQGSYTSKGYIETLMQDIIWDKIYELCPDVETYLRDETKRCIDYAMSDVEKIPKQQLVTEVIDGLFSRFECKIY